MDWLKERTGQLTLFVGILSTLTGFGWAGAELYNRLVVVEKKIQSSATVKNSVIEIEKRFEALETSVSYMNKTIDETILIKIDGQSNKVEAIKSDMSGMKADIESVKTDIKIFKEENKNPLAG